MEAFQSQEQTKEQVEAQGELQREALRLEIYDMLAKYNDFSLVKRHMAPNENTIYHLYSSGNLTYQKGGDAYLRRSEFNDTPSINTNLNLDITKFIYKIPYDDYGRFLHCVMVTRENAILIRNKMLELEKLM